MRSRTAIAALTACIALGSASDADACSCMMPLPPAEAVAQADAVFQGTVAEVRISDASSRGTPYAYFVRFRVRKGWKGVSSTEVVVGTGAGGGDCGKHFEPGVEYLVYASPIRRRPVQPDGGSMDGRQPPMLETHICTRTAQISQAREDLHYLRAKKPLRLQPPSPRTEPAKAKR